MASTVQHLFQRPARRPSKPRRHRPDPYHFESLESRAMLAVVLPAAGNQLGVPLSLATDGSGPNALSITIDDSSGTLFATITANTASGTVTNTYSNFNRQITFAGSFDTDGSEANAVTLSAPFGVALASDVADFYSWISICDFSGGDVTVTTVNADSLVVRNPAGGAAGSAPSSVDGTFTTPTSAPSPTTPGAAISFETNSTVTVGGTRPVQTYDLSITGVNNGTLSAIDLDSAVGVTNALRFVDSNTIAIVQDISSTGGSVEIQSTKSGVTVDKSIAAANGNVTILASSNIDLSTADGLAVGPTAGTITLTSTQGTVVFNATTPLPLVAGGNLAVTSALDLAVDVDLTSTNGDVTLTSTKGAMTLTKAVTATAGSIAITSDRTLDLSGATSLTTGAIAGSLSLVSTQGKVLLNATSPALNLVAVGDVLVRSGQELKVEVDVTSATGTVLLESTGDSLRVFNPVTATTGTVTLRAGATGVVQVDDAVQAGTGITATSGGGFDLNDSLTTTNGSIAVTVTGVGSTIDLGGATAVTAGGSSGSIALVSDKGGVVLKSGMPLSADQNITIRSDLDFELTAALTSRFGDIELKSTGGKLDIAGTVNVLAGDLVLEAAGTIDDGSGGTVGILLVTGATSVKAGTGEAITLDNATGPGHDFTGPVSVLRGGEVKLADRNTIELGAITISGGITVNATGITQSGAIVQTTGVAPAIFDAGTGTIALTAANDFRGPVTLTNSGTASVAIRDINQIDLALVDVGTGTLSVTAVGIVQSGAILQAAGAGVATFAGGAGGITLTDVGNVVTGAVALTSSTDVTFANTLAVALGTSAVGGNLDLTANGPITQAGPVSVTGTTTLTAGATNSITLADAGNNFGGAVTVASGKDVSLADANALVLGASTVSGNLVVAAKGAISQTGALTVAGTTSLEAGAANAIALTDAGNEFTGAVTVVSGKNVALADATAVLIDGATVSGSFAVTAGGAISQSAPIAVTGVTILAAGPTHDITFDDAGNDFGGDVTVTSGRDVTLRDANAVQFGGKSVVGRDLDVRAAGAVTDGAAGTLAVTGLAVIRAVGAFSDIALDNVGHDFNGDVTLEAGRDATLGGTRAIQFGGTSTVGRNLLVTAAGVISDGTAGKLDVTGRTTLVATGPTGDIVIDNAGHDLGSDVTVTSGRDTTLKYDAALEFGGASTVAGNLFVTAAGSITDGLLGTLAVTGAAFLTTTTAADILLDNAHDFTGDVTLKSGRDATLNDIDAIQFGGQSDIAGDLRVTAGGSITSGGGASLTVAGTTLLAATAGTSDVVLPGGNVFSGGVTVQSAKNATLGSAGALEFAGASAVGGNLTATAGGSITDGTTATLAVVGAAVLATSGAASDIVLDNFGHTLAGNVTVTSTQDVTLRTLGGVTFGGASSVGRDLSVTAGGAIGDGATGSLTVVGVTSLTATGGSGGVTLDNGHDFGGDVTVSSSGGATLTGLGAIQFGGASTIAGALKVTAAGSIGDGKAGTLAVTGPTTLTATGAASDIDLENAGHAFGSVITFASGRDTKITHVGPIAVGAGSTVDRDLVLTAAGPITQSGALKVTGTTTLEAGSSNDITLADVGNDFTGPVAVVSAEDVTLVDVNTLVLGGGVVSGGLAVTAAGDITQTAGLAVTGGTSLTAGAANDITLGQAKNNFGGPVAVVSGKDVTLTDATALVLGASKVSGTLTVRADGAITQTGGLAVTGTTSVTAGAANDVTLDDAANDFQAALSVLSANDATLRDANALLLGTVTTSGNLVVTAAGSITQSGSLAIAGTTNLAATGKASTIVLGGANDFVGGVTVASEGATTLNDTSSILFDGASKVGGDLLVTAAEDTTIAATGSVTVGGKATFTTKEDFTLLGTLETAGDASITTTKADAVIDLSAPGSKLLVGGTLTLDGSGGVKLNPTQPISTGGGFSLVSKSTDPLVVAAPIKALVGPITLTNTLGDLAIKADLETDGKAGVINLTAGREINNGTDNGAVTASVVANRLVAVAGANAGLFSPKFQFTSAKNEIDELSVTLTNGSGAAFNNVGSLKVDTLVTDRGTVVFESTAGGITVVPAVGAASTLTGITLLADDAVEVNGALIVDGKGDIVVTSASNKIVVSGDIRANEAAGTVTLTSGGGAGISLSGDVFAGTDVFLQAAGTIAIGQAGSPRLITAQTGNAVLESAAGGITLNASVSAVNGRVDVVTAGAVTLGSGSITAAPFYGTKTETTGLAPASAGGVVLIRGRSVTGTPPTVSAGRLEVINEGLNDIAFSGNNGVGSLFVSMPGRLTFNNFGNLAITDFDPTRVTSQVSAGAVTITSTAGRFRVVDGLTYAGGLSLAAPNSGLGVEFVTTAVSDTDLGTIGGRLGDMLGHVTLNTATAAGQPNAVMSAVFDEPDSPVATGGTITVATALPAVTKRLTFDGSLPVGGANLGGVVGIDGSGIKIANTAGLQLTTSAGGSTVRDAAIGGFTGTGVFVAGSANRLSNLLVGFGRDGITKAGNGAGIDISGAGATYNAVTGNVVGNNAGIGIRVRNSAFGSVVSGNTVGADQAGDVAANGGDGIAIDRAQSILVGGVTTPERNVVVNNAGSGVSVTGVVAKNTTGGVQVLGNTIRDNAAAGVTIRGSSFTQVGNSRAGSGNLIERTVSGVQADGVQLVASTAGVPAANNTVVGNTIAGNSRHGVSLVGGHGNTIQGNTLTGNALTGVRIFGALAKASEPANRLLGNVISGSGTNANEGGIVVDSSSGQFVGVTAAGAAAGNILTGNTGSGIVVRGTAAHRLNTVASNTVTASTFDGIRVAGAAATAVRRNAVSGNGAAGIAVVESLATATTATLVQGNTASGNAVGVRVAGSRFAQIGGQFPAEGNNVFSNTGHGIVVEGSTATGAAAQTTIRNNLIGVDSGSTAAGNAGAGIRVNSGSGTTIDYRNVIRNNSAGGIHVVGGSNTVIGSGLAGRGNTISGNTGDGVLVEAPATGSQPLNLTVAGNVIEGNTGNGVEVTGARASSVTIGRGPSITAATGAGNTIRGNDLAGIVVDAAQVVTMIGNSVSGNGTGAIELINGANSGIQAPMALRATLRPGNSRVLQYEVRGSVPVPAGRSAGESVYVDVYMDLTSGGQAYMGRVLARTGSTFRVILNGPAANGVGLSAIRATATGTSGGLFGDTSVLSDYAT